jgi:CheY-like chemotaxis protein
MSYASAESIANAVTCPPAGRHELCGPPTASSAAVLVVAGDHSLQDSCRRTLSAAGVGVVVAVSKNPPALELLSSGKLFDAVVISMGEKDADAMDLLRQVHRRSPTTPTIVLSPRSSLVMSSDPRQAETNPCPVRRSLAQLIRTTASEKPVRPPVRSTTWTRFQSRARRAG